MKIKNNFFIISAFINIVFIIGIWINFFLMANNYSTLGNESEGSISAYILILFPIYNLIIGVSGLMWGKNLAHKNNNLDSNNILLGTIFFSIITISFMNFLFLKYSHIIQIDIFKFISYLLISSFYCISILCYIATTGKSLGIRLKCLRQDKQLNKSVNFTVATVLLFTTTISLIVSFFIEGWISLLISFLLGFSTIYISVAVCLKKMVK